VKRDVDRIQLIDRREQIARARDTRAELEPRATDLTRDLGPDDRVIEILLRRVGGGLGGLELRARVVDVLLCDRASGDERLETRDRALGIVEPSDGAAVRGIVPNDVEPVEDLAFRDERPLGEWRSVMMPSTRERTSTRR
jgi:hypothetical protein